jgi:hypothetical protein
MNNCQFLDKCAAPETLVLYTFRRLAVFTSSGKGKGIHFVVFVIQNLSAPLGYEAGICKYQKVRCMTQPPYSRRKIPRYPLYRRQGGFKSQSGRYKNRRTLSLPVIEPVIRRPTELRVSNLRGWWQIWSDRGVLCIGNMTVFYCCGKLYDAKSTAEII